MLFNTINEIILTCTMLVNGMNIEQSYHTVYNNSLVEVNLSLNAAKNDRIRACVEIADLALRENVDPILAIAVAKHESKFARKIVGGIGKISKPKIPKNVLANKSFKLDKEVIKGSPSLGILQVIPKYWCKLQSGRTDWDSKTDVLFIPKTQRSCKKKKKLKVNHYYDDHCQEIYCNLENCDFIECDLEKAGIIALQTYTKIYKKNMVELLCHYNYGNTDKQCPPKSIKYANSIISDMSRINKYFKRMKSKSKIDQIILLSFSNTPLDLIIPFK